MNCKLTFITFLLLFPVLVMTIDGCGAGTRVEWYDKSETTYRCKPCGEGSYRHDSNHMETICSEIPFYKMGQYTGMSDDGSACITGCTTYTNTSATVFLPPWYVGKI